MENERWLSDVPTKELLRFVSHRVSAKVLDYLKQGRESEVISDLIKTNGQDDNRELGRLLAKVRDNYYHLLTS